MENIKKNPILMAVLNVVGVAGGLLLVDFVLSLINKQSFAERISDPVSIIILIVGPIACGISGYLKAKKNISGRKEKVNPQTV